MSTRGVNTGVPALSARETVSRLEFPAKQSFNDVIGAPQPGGME